MVNLGGGVVYILRKMNKQRSSPFEATIECTATAKLLATPMILHYGPLPLYCNY